MATAQDILKAAEMVGFYGSEEGAYVVRPPVIAREKENGGIFPIVAVDVGIGGRPGRVLFVQDWEQEKWNLADNYEIPRVMAWTCPIKECEGNEKGSICAGFCARCGTALEQVPLGLMAENTPCPECKARVVFPQDKFCSACGAELTSK